MKARIFFSVIAVVVFGWLKFFVNTAAPVITGAASVKQLENSDAAYMVAQYGMHLPGWLVSVLSVILLVLLLAIWWKPLKGFTKGASPVAMLAALCILFGASQANAYYDTANRQEWIEIPANCTGFLIPLVGANLDSQAKFMSLDFLNAKKVPTKRVEIPHVQMKTAAMERDIWVPAAKLILVDRSYYAREWVKSNAKGTSKNDESITFETADSINGYTGFMAEALVTEENAAQFLYTFGVKPDTGKYESENHRQFASVVWGYSLADIMDNNVRRKAHSVAAREYGARSTAEVIKQKKAVIDIVNNETIAAYKDTGITIRYIGYAEGLTWENLEVQKAIDSVFIAETQAKAVENRKQILQVSQLEADVDIKKGIAAGVKNWKGEFPMVMLWSHDIVEWVKGIFNSEQPVKTMAPATVKK